MPHLLTRRRVPPVAAAALLALAAACGGATTGPDARGGARGASVTVRPAADTARALGARRDFSAEISAPGGQEVSEVEAAWTVSDTAVASVDGEGVAAAVGPGSARIVARYGEVADTARLVVAPEVARVVVSPAADTVEALSGRAALSAEARDANGNPVPSAGLSWSSSDTSVATVDDGGEVTGRWPGRADVVAGADGEADTARVTVVDPDGDQPPRAAIEAPGDGSRFGSSDTITFRGSAADLEDGALAGSELVWHSDVDGRLGTGDRVTTWSLSSGDHTVTLTATDGGGRTGGDTVGVTVGSGVDLVLDRVRVLGRGVLATESARAGGVVRNAGEAAAGAFGWTLRVDGSAVARGRVDGLAAGDSLRLGLDDVGPLPAGRHRVEVTVDVGDEVAESDESNNSAWERIASYRRGFSIELHYLADVDSAYRAAVDSAVARWERLITADLPDIEFSVPESFDFCADGAGQRSAPIDDVLVFVRVDSLDGPHGTLARAGPCGGRWDEEAGRNLTAVAGRVTLDAADLDRLASDGRLVDLVLHELGHVLGVGSWWSSHGLRAEAGPDDPIYVGPAGRRGFAEVGGDSYAGAPVPAANAGGRGTEGVHWRESVLEDELMTGFLDGANPLSRVTARSLADQYYAVDPSAADGFRLSGAVPLRVAGPRIDLGDDLARIPVRGFDRRGRVLHVAPPGPERRPVR